MVSIQRKCNCWCNGTTMVLHHGLDAFNGYVAFMICTLMLTAIYTNLQELFKKTLSPFFETLFIKFPNYGKKGKVEIEDKETTEEESWTKETDTNPPLSMDYAQIRLSAMKAKEQAEQEKLTTVLTYTRESFAPYMKEEDLNILCEYICLFHADKDIPKVVRTVKVDSAIRTIDLMHFGWNIGYHCRLPAANPAGRGHSPSDEQEESAPENID